MNSFELAVKASNFPNSGADEFNEKFKEIRGISGYNVGMKYQAIKDAYIVMLAAQFLDIQQHLKIILVEKGVIGSAEDILKSCNDFTSKRQRAVTEAFENKAKQLNLTDLNEQWVDNTLSGELALHGINTMAVIKQYSDEKRS